MRFIANRFMLCFISLVCLISSVFGVPDAEKIQAKQYAMSGGGSCEAGGGRIGIHDPSVIKSKDGSYYVFGSHMAAARSDDLLNWSEIACGVGDGNRLLVPEGSTLRKELSEPLSWADAFQSVSGVNEEDWQTNIWAADVIYNEEMGKYCYYASSSVWGLPQSVIWFATSDSIEGPYKYENTVVYSGFDNLVAENGYSRATPLHYSFTNITSVLKKGDLYIKDVLNNSWCDINGRYDSGRLPNAIDPALFYDAEGRMWMAYGSYYAGIYIMPLEEKTGLPDYEYMQNTEGYDMYFGKQIMRTNGANELSGEGAYVIYDAQSGYYYLYLSVGGLNSLGGYNIREYRSKNPDGPFLDAAGNDAMEDVNTGIKLFGNYTFDCLETAYLAAGHSSVLIDSDGKMLQVYHTRFNNGSEDFQVRVHQMARTENGWTVALPFEYTGETIDYRGTVGNELAGEYEFINHGTLTNGCTDWADAEKIISPTQSITLDSDGTVRGLKLYESVKNNTAVSFTQAEGEWSVKEGTAYITFILDGVKYEGVFCKQSDESGERTERLVFSAVGENNECIWGVKK